ncbi:hypothetical protein [Mucilaginibacter pineti]|uniref:hypothetical protein n=1 Tax=Mucilaginibacter pineti TaxID=1391627 RepID=UPI000B84BBB6
MLIVLNLDAYAATIRLENVTAGGYQDLLRSDSYSETDGNCLMITIPACAAMILPRHENIK